MVRESKKQVLRQQLSSGGYVVDPQAVAEAILRIAGHRTSSMFVAFQPPERGASGTAQHESPSRRDLA
jgi:hypothetical protein